MRANDRFENLSRCPVYLHRLHFPLMIGSSPLSFLSLLFFPLLFSSLALRDLQARFRPKITTFAPNFGDHWPGSENARFTICPPLNPLLPMRKGDIIFHMDARETREEREKREREERGRERNAHSFKRCVCARKMYFGLSANKAKIFTHASRTWMWTVVLNVISSGIFFLVPYKENEICSFSHLPLLQRNYNVDTSQVLSPAKLWLI